MAVPDGGLFLERTGVGWHLAGDGAGRFGLVNDYLSYLVDRKLLASHDPAPMGSGLLAFCRWLGAEDLDLAEVTTDVLLRFLTACRSERVAGRPGGANVVGLDERRTDTLSPATTSHRGSPGAALSQSPIQPGPRTHLRDPQLHPQPTFPRRASLAHRADALAAATEDRELRIKGVSL